MRARVYAVNGPLHEILRDDGRQLKMSNNRDVDAERFEEGDASVS